MNSNDPLQKTDFGAIYDQPDPRAYFLTLAPHEYVIPQSGAEVFTRLLEARNAPGRASVLDVCCSYGVVATMMKTGVGIETLTKHYCEAKTQELTRDELLEIDRKLLQEHGGSAPFDVVGLDTAGNAVAYAIATGSLETGVVANLEADELPAELAALVSDVDMITTTGGIGYVTERTFRQLMSVAREDVWVASFCLRTYDYGPIGETLAAHGLVTERLPRTFRQRRFTDPEEERWATTRVRERGLDPAGKEDTGHYHADFFLSRPARDVERQSLLELLPEE